MSLAERRGAGKQKRYTFLHKELNRGCASLVFELPSRFSTLMLTALCLQPGFSGFPGGKRKFYTPSPYHTTAGEVGMHATALWQNAETFSLVWQGCINSTGSMLYWLYTRTSSIL
jgi:hypothetical protein